MTVVSMFCYEVLPFFRAVEYSPNDQTVFSNLGVERRSQMHLEHRNNGMTAPQMHFYHVQSRTNRYEIRAG